MTTEEFLLGLKRRAADSAVRNTISVLEKPVGRRPSAKDLRLSNWYLSLDSVSKEALKEVLQEAAGDAVFGVLCILDGARVIEEAVEKGEFELFYVKDERKLLNPPETSLHEAYRKFLES